MNYRIIYTTDEDNVAVIVPSQSTNLSIEQIAQKDVPAGKPYKIISLSDVPSDRIFRNAWEADLSNPDGYGIGQEAWFANKEQSE